MNKDKIEELFNANELRRLEKAARDKDKRKLVDWAKQFEVQLNQEYEKKYEQSYQEQLLQAIDNYMVAIVYSLHFSEETKFGKKRLNRFLSDVLVTIDMFRTGEYNPEEYKEILLKDGIEIFSKNKEE